ncbi:MAG TPA: GyrI-like domain-containing protein [Gemmatimonadales bacterium]|nr:GyrI-like domain-containing protein [Gemmatimonadales bacterium]
MPPELRRSRPRHVAGLAARTTNAAEANPATGKIPQLWGQFRNDKWFDRLAQAGAVGPPIGVYSAYESDVSGSYQILVGREVRTPSPLSPPLQIVSVPEGRYLVFRRSGPLPQVVIDGWQEAWEYFARSDAPARAYTFDFEINLDATSVEIWVAVRDTHDAIRDRRSR